MKRLLIFFLWMLALNMSAQTFYEVTYVDPDDNETYIGLMIYYDDEHCQVRFINDEMLQKDEVAESNYVQKVMPKESRNDVGVMVYAPEEEEFPTLVWLWEKDDASDISEKPYCTFDPADSNTYFETKNFAEITLHDMSKEYIEQFFNEGEAEYKMLMRGISQAQNTIVHNISPSNYGAVGGVATTNNGGVSSTHYGTVSSTIQGGIAPSSGLGQNPGNVSVGGNSGDIATTVVTPPAPVDASTPTLRLLVAANTDISDIGAACRRDLNNLRNEFSGIANALGMGYDEQIVADEYYNKANVVKMIRGAHANPNDVLIFVYTGHGFRFDDQRDYYPNIDFRMTSYDDPQKQYAAMSDVYNEIVAKGARLSIVLSDCCNAFIGVEAPMSNMNSLFSRANTNFDIEKLQKLFLGSSGRVRATASSPGEVSWCGMNGGFFILSFLESLHSQISPLQSANPSWEQLINNAIVAAKKKSVSGANTKAQNGLQQVQTKEVKFDAPARKSEPEMNVAPGAGGNTLDL